MSNVTNPTAANPLLRLLQLFNAESLGEGDLVAGANVLAAKCISIANLHPPGTCLIISDGKRLQVGMSFVTSGGLTSSLVSETVLDPIAIIQNNVVDHLSADAKRSARLDASWTPDERIRARPKTPVDQSSIGTLEMELDPNSISQSRGSLAFQ
jgi:hypothetical protein